jgi:hypothetical protein
MNTGVGAPIVMGGLIQWTGRYEAGSSSWRPRGLLSAALVTRLRACRQELESGFGGGL